MENAYKSADEIMKQPFARLRMETSEKFFSQKLTLADFTEMSTQMLHLAEQIPAISVADLGIETKKAYEFLKSGKCEQYPEIKNPAQQYVWGLALACAETDRKIRARWSEPEKSRPIYKLEVWDKLKHSAPAISELRRHAFMVAEMPFLKEDVEIKWGACKYPSVGFYFNPEDNLINLDLVWALIGGFEHSRAAQLHEIGHSRGTLKFTQKMNDLKKQYDELNAKARKRTIKKEEYKQLKTVAREYQYLFSIFDEAENSYANRFAVNASDFGMVRQDIGYDLNSIETQLFSVGTDIEKNRQEFKLPPDTPANRAYNFKRALRLSFYVNNDIIEDDAKGWQDLGVNLDWLEYTDDSGQIITGPEALKKLRDLTQKLEEAQLTEREYHKPEKDILALFEAYSLKRCEVIDEIYDRFAKKYYDRDRERAEQEEKKRQEQQQKNQQNQKQGGQEGEGGQGGQEGQQGEKQDGESGKNGGSHTAGNMDDHSDLPGVDQPDDKVDEGDNRKNENTDDSDILGKGESKTGKDSQDASGDKEDNEGQGDDESAENQQNDNAGEENEDKSDGAGGEDERETSGEGEGEDGTAGEGEGEDEQQAGNNPHDHQNLPGVDGQDNSIDEEGERRSGKSGKGGEEEASQEGENGNRKGLKEDENGDHEMEVPDENGDREKDEFMEKFGKEVSLDELTPENMIPLEDLSNTPEEEILRRIAELIQGIADGDGMDVMDVIRMSPEEEQKNCEGKYDTTRRERKDKVKVKSDSAPVEFHMPTRLVRENEYQQIVGKHQTEIERLRQKFIDLQNKYYDYVPDQEVKSVIPDASHLRVDIPSYIERLKKQAMGEELKEKDFENYIIDGEARAEEKAPIDIVILIDNSGSMTCDNMDRTAIEIGCCLFQATRDNPAFNVYVEMMHKPTTWIAKPGENSVEISKRLATMMKYNKYGDDKIGACIEDTIKEVEKREAKTSHEGLINFFMITDGGHTDGEDSFPLVEKIIDKNLPVTFNWMLTEEIDYTYIERLVEDHHTGIGCKRIDYVEEINGKNMLEKIMPMIEKRVEDAMHIEAQRTSDKKMDLTAFIEKNGRGGK